MDFLYLISALLFSLISNVNIANTAIHHCLNKECAKPVHGLHQGSPYSYQSFEQNVSGIVWAPDTLDDSQLRFWVVKNGPGIAWLVHLNKINNKYYSQVSQTLYDPSSQHDFEGVTILYDNNNQPKPNHLFILNEGGKKKDSIQFYQLPKESLISSNRNNIENINHYLKYKWSISQKINPY
ncbi:hypothetical protein [Piscirickettsia litoralis]|uniref:Secreted protein n=1 Tax=Piscirickettsia litoralis TaxID=1891921 RepID=A0ABX3A803_9GAMM|nr:hypothetical protein [Piscirickettsia litoralis]ODN43670.1 hypothetical protein BGC07_13120 [Piscirickettsia litoralis]